MNENDKLKDSTRIKNINEIDLKQKYEMEKQSRLKTGTTIFISLLTIIISIGIKLAIGKCEEILTELTLFLTKGSLITILISNISSIMSNIYFEKRLSKSGENTTTYLVFDNKNESSDSIEANFLMKFLIILIISIILYTIIVIVNMNHFTFIGCIILYLYNIRLIYKYNLYREMLNPDKYNFYKQSMENDIDNLKKANDIHNIEGVELWEQLM